MPNLLKIVLGSIPVLFCGILLVLQFGFAAGLTLTVLLAGAGLVALVRKGDALDRVLRLLLLPLLGRAGVSFGSRPPDPGPVFVFLDIELDRRPLGSALAACMAAAAVHAARLAGRFSSRGRRAIQDALAHDFAPPPDPEWLTYILERTDSLLATLEPVRACERSLDEVIGLAAKLAGPRRHETMTLLFVLVYQALLLDGNGQIDSERFFAHLGRRHGLSPGEISRAKAAGLYYRHAFAERERERRRAGAKSRDRADRRRRSRGTATSPPGGPDPEALRLFQLEANYDAEDLERAWKRVLHAHHPDRHHQGDRRRAHERFLAAKRAYESLRERLLQPERETG